MLEKIIKKVMVSRNLRWKNSCCKFRETIKLFIHSPPRNTPCRLFIHEVFFGPLGLHLRVWNEPGRSPPFRPMRALRLAMVTGLHSCVWSGPNSSRTLRRKASWACCHLMWKGFQAFNSTVAGLKNEIPLFNMNPKLCVWLSCLAQFLEGLCA